MVEPIDPRILAARLDPTLGPQGIGQPGTVREPQLPAPGQPTFAEIMNTLQDASETIPDPSKAQTVADLESLSNQLDTLHNNTMAMYQRLAELADQLTNDEQSGDGTER
ncbi:MAG TPA: hypothetical protein PLZ55_06485 [bacterium]|nr:hypothetical protein [bacterium]